MLILSARRQAAGFTLVELMVALVLGLIVVGAVLALVLSVMKSNRQTIQTTRLTQELRSVTAVVANDLRRARGVADPLVEAKLSGGSRYKNIDYSTAGCVRYAYAGAIGGDCHAIMKSTSGTNPNRVFLSTGAYDRTTGCAAVVCAANGAGTMIGSDQVEITNLTFAPYPSGTPAADKVRAFNVTVTGRLVTGDSEIGSIQRTISELVYVRSIGTGN